MGKIKTRIKPDLDDYRLKLIKENLEKPPSYYRKTIKSYCDAEDFRRY